MLPIWAFLVLLAPCSADRTFTVYNACPFTIWPAIYTDMSVGNAVPEMSTGWVAAANTSVTFSVPDGWTSGRIWGRRDCDFSAGSTSPDTCLDGGCNGGLICDAYTGTGVPPATVAEWTLGGTGTGADNYDVSLVDGYNLPMRITPTAGCPIAECPYDLGPTCPAALQGPFDTTGFPVGCRSACTANLDGDPTNSPNCCSGSYDTPATCPNSGVQYYWYFKGWCPRAYAYAYDESSGTALWTCPASSAADYTLTFCPPNDEAASSAAPGSSTVAVPSTSSSSSAGSTLLSKSTTTTTTTRSTSQPTQPPSPSASSPSASHSTTTSRSPLDPSSAAESLSHSLLPALLISLAMDAMLVLYI